MTNLPQQTAHDFALPLPLIRVAHMLQLTAAADAKDRAGGLDTQRRRLVQFSDRHPARKGLPVASVPFWWRGRCLHGDSHALARQACGDQDSRRMWLAIGTWLANLRHSQARVRQFTKDYGMISYGSLFLH